MQDTGETCLTIVTFFCECPLRFTDSLIWTLISLISLLFPDLPDPYFLTLYITFVKYMEEFSPVL